MAFAQRIITSNSAGDQEFTFTFDYIKEEHIKVFVNFVEKAQGTGSNEFQVITNTTPKKISLNTGLSANNTRVEIRRVSSLSTPLVDFADGSTLTATDLDTAEKQSLFIDQELDDALKQGISIDTSTGIPTLSSQRLSNVADPVNAQDVVTKAYLERSGSITSTQIADGTIVDGDIANATITGAKLVNDTITALQIAPNAIAASELADSAVDTNAVVDDAITYAKIQNVSATDRILGRDSSGAGIIEEITPANVRTMLNVEDGATADQTASEIRTLVEAASDSNVFTDADHTKLNAIEASADVTDATNVDAAGAVMNSDTTTAAMQFVVDEDNFSSDLDTKVPTQQSTKAYIAATSQPLDSELTQLSGMQSATASKLADSTALTSDLADLNQLDGMAKQTTITDDDTKFPTSGAVVDFVAAQIAPIGGLEVITNETVFPATQPSSGVVISIADAGGLAVNGSGVASNARTSGSGSDNVTINGFPSSLFSQTLGAGLGLMVTSTGSSNTYNYHKLLAKEVDVKQLSDDINDFGQRYRVVNTVSDATGNEEGDLIYAKDQNKLLVYDTSLSPAAFKETQSVGNFFVATLTPAFNGSLIDFTLSNAPTNAQQVLLSIGGVIQKPNEGTSRPSEGFSLNGSTLQLPTGSAPASGTDYFAIVMGSSVNLATPGNNTVTSAILQNGSVIADKIGTGAVTEVKIQAFAVTETKIGDQAVTLAKLQHGTSSTDGKFLRSNNGADPTFETVNTNLVADLTPQLGGNLDVNFKNILFTDSASESDDRLIFGSGNDLQLYHNGTNSVLQNRTGNLRIEAKQGELGLNIVPDAGVALYYDGNKKLETISAGVRVDDNLEVDGSILGTGTSLEVGNYGSDGSAAVKRIRMTQGGEIHFGDTTTSNFIGITEGTVSQFNDQDRLGIYYRNELKLFSNNNNGRWIWDSSGHYLPVTNNAVDIGSTSKRVRNIYTNDLNLSNEGGANDVDGTWGSYTIQEGAEDLFLINKRNGKKYKFNLAEVT